MVADQPGGTVKKAGQPGRFWPTGRAQTRRLQVLASRTVDDPGLRAYSSVVSDLPPPERLYRAMKRDADGKPLCGTRASELGIRPGVDITADADGQVHPMTGGLSTTPDDPTLLPPHVRPLNLGGRGMLPVFVVDAARLDGALAARRDPQHPRDHVFVEPAFTMALTSLQALLRAGRDHWEVVS